MGGASRERVPPWGPRGPVAAGVNPGVSSWRGAHARWVPPRWCSAPVGRAAAAPLEPCPHPLPGPPGSAGDGSTARLFL